MNRQQRRRALRDARRGAAGDTRAQLEQALQLRDAGRPAAAEAICRRLLDTRPDCVPALQLSAVLAHQRGDDSAARGALERAIELQPDGAALHYNLGEVHRDRGRHAAAVASYQRALALQPALADGHFNLGNALFALGQFGAAAEALSEAARRAPDDAEVQLNLGNALDELARSGDGNSDDSGDSDELDRRAGEHYRRAAQLAPHDPRPACNLGHWLRRQRRDEAALGQFSRAAALAPQWPAAQLALADTLRSLARHGEALQAYLRIAVLADADGGVAVERASDAGHRAGDHHASAALEGAAQCLAALGRYDEAEQHLRALVERQPRRARSHYLLGCCLESQGRFDAAIRAHLAALDRQSDLCAAWYHLSLIRDFRADAAQLDRLETLLARGELDDDSRIHLHFALAGLRGGTRGGATAIAHYRRGNALKARQRPFDAAGHTAWSERLIEFFDRDFFTARHNPLAGRHSGSDSQLPVFIVGMPRCGSTLVEQILASHPSVAGAGELEDMRTLLRRLPELLGSDQVFPDCAAQLDGSRAQALADEYLAARRRQAPAAARVCDKMLGNYARLGLIALLFPRARVIHCRRDPLDTCLSCYCQHFEHGHRYSYDLRHLGVAYRNYQRLMAHWRQVLPMPLLEIDYEALVADQETVTRRLLDFLGLDWDARCLRFHEQRRGVHTASAWQVRQPLYNTAVGRWRNWRDQLQPLIEALDCGPDHSPDRGPDHSPDRAENLLTDG